jgi:hypothetical protein
VSVRFAASLALAALLAACSPGAPEGVDKSVLDAAVSRAVGDPGTCVLLGERGSGELVYRYNSHMVCGRSLASCAGPAQTVGDLLKAVAADGRARAISCDSPADPSRSVGWAAGSVAGTNLVYAAVMEGDRTFPGRIMAERLDTAFRDAGVNGPVRKAR